MDLDLQGLRRAGSIPTSSTRRWPQIGRAFARALGSRGHPGGPTAGGARARHAPVRVVDGRAIRARHRGRGADVLDIGMAGTEMVYWTVGSRELDGGLMCTASHNPASYTGAKLVRRGALALSGDAGIGDLREIVSAGEPVHRPRSRAGSTPRTWPSPSAQPRWGTSTPMRSPRSRSCSTAATGWPARWWDPCSTRFPSSSSRPTGSPTATSRTTSPTPCWRRTGASSSTRCARAALIWA